MSSLTIVSNLSFSWKLVGNFKCPYVHNSDKTLQKSIKITFFTKSLNFNRNQYIICDTNTRDIHKVISACKYCWSSAVITMARMRTKFPCYLPGYRHHVQTCQGLYALWSVFIMFKKPAECETRSAILLSNARNVVPVEKLFVKIVNWMEEEYMIVYNKSICRTECDCLMNVAKMYLIYEGACRLWWIKTWWGI